MCYNIGITKIVAPKQYYQRSNTMPTTAELIDKLRELGEKTPETRSKRLQVLVTPTMFDALKSLSAETGLSVNEIVNVALGEYLKG